MLVTPLLPLMPPFDIPCRTSTRIDDYQKRGLHPFCGRGEESHGKDVGNAVPGVRGRIPARAHSCMRTVFRAARSDAELGRDHAQSDAGKHSGGAVLDVALSRSAARGRPADCRQKRRLDAARESRKSGPRTGPEQSVHQERCRKPSHALVSRIASSPSP